MSYCAFEDLEAGARPLGMGAAFTAVGNDANTLYWNPAGIRLVPNAELTSFYSRPFNLNELSYGLITFIMPTQWFSTGLSFRTFGEEIYNERILLFSLGREIHPRILLGMNFRLMMLSIKNDSGIDYGSDQALGMDLGVLFRLGRGVQLGGYFHNINKPTIAQNNELLPQIFSIGIAYVPVCGLTLAMDLYKDLDFPYIYRIGQEFRFSQYLALRAGWQTSSWRGYATRFTSGIGLYWKQLEVDYAYFSHATLGGTHQIGFTIRLGSYEDTNIFDFGEKKSYKTAKKIEKLKLGETININTADINGFCRLPNIGPKKAQKIIAFRERAGGFKRKEELMLIEGIGQKTYEKLEPYIRIDNGQ